MAVFIAGAAALGFLAGKYLGEHGRENRPQVRASILNSISFESSVNAQAIISVTQDVGFNFLQNCDIDLVFCTVNGTVSCTQDINVKQKQFSTVTSDYSQQAIEDIKTTIANDIEQQVKKTETNFSRFVDNLLGSGDPDIITSLNNTFQEAMDVSFTAQNLVNQSAEMTANQRVKINCFQSTINGDITSEQQIVVEWTMKSLLTQVIDQMIDKSIELDLDNKVKQTLETTVIPGWLWIVIALGIVLVLVVIGVIIFFVIRGSMRKSPQPRYYRPGPAQQQQPQIQIIQQSPMPMPQQQPYPSVLSSPQYSPLPSPVRSPVMMNTPPVYVQSPYSPYYNFPRRF